MNGPEVKAIWKAYKKVKDACDIVAWEYWMNSIPGTWAFKHKQCPDASVCKHKAWFCAHGDMQIEGVDHFETFAPVVNWTTVRLLHVLSLILGWSSKQVDYATAFLHAPITDEVFVETPQGFREPGKVLKLKCSLCSLKQSLLSACERKAWKR